MSADSKFRSRKWMLTVIVQLFTSAALVGGLLGGDEFVMITTMNVGAYSAANTAIAWVNK